MQPFHPVNLENINRSLAEKYPLAEDFANADLCKAEDILFMMREQNKSFFEISALDLRFAFQMACICADEEFEVLKTAVFYKADKTLFRIGFIYFQANAEDSRTIELFSAIISKFSKNQPEAYNRSLIGKTGLPLDEIYTRSVKIMRQENLSFEDFCRQYEIIKNSVFYGNLKLAYLSECEKEEFPENEAFLLESIFSAKASVLSPALRNFTEKLEFEEISEQIKNAILGRLSSENSDTAIGLSDAFLEEIRQQKYGKILKENISTDLKKLDVYLAVVNKIRNIELLENGYFSIVFEKYTVIDNIRWDNYAYAYSRQNLENLFESWLALGMPQGTTGPPPPKKKS